MLINDENMQSTLELFSTEIIGEKVKVSLKNGSTLTLTPGLNDEGVITYNIEYLTGKENKSIEKINKKIAELESQIQKIKENDGNDADTDGDGDTEKDPNNDENQETEQF